MQQDNSHHFKFYPTTHQEAMFQKYFGCHRFIYNNLLQELKARYRKWEERSEETRGPVPEVSLQQLVASVSSMTRRYDWLTDVPISVLVNATTKLWSDFAGFFDGTKNYPRFIEKDGDQTICIDPIAFGFKDAKVYVAGRPLKLRGGIETPKGNPLKLIVSRNTKCQWHVILLLDIKELVCCPA